MRASVSWGIFARRRRFARSGRVALAFYQGFEHRSTRDAGDVTCYRGELYPRVFEELLEALDLASAFAGDGGARPCEIAQLADGLGWDERSPDEAVGAELGEPGGV